MKVEKKKIVFLSVIGVVLLFIVGYSVFVLGGEDENANGLQQTLVPELEEGEEMYSSKKVAVDAIKKEKERIAPSIYDERFLDESGMYDENLLDKKKQRMVDSIYRLGRIDYSDNSYQGKLKRPLKRTKIKKDNSIEKEKDTSTILKAMGLEHQLFFVVNPGVLEGGIRDVLKEEVDGEQTIKINDRLQMRTTEDAIINGTKVLRNTIVYAIVKFRPNRVILEVENIDHISMELQAFDLADGLEGIYIKNSFRGDVFNEVLGDVVEDINVPGVPQVGGIKKVFQRNNRNVKVTVNNNYKLLLKTEL